MRAKGRVDCTSPRVLVWPWTLSLLPWLVSVVESGMKRQGQTGHGAMWRRVFPLPEFPSHTEKSALEVNENQPIGDRVGAKPSSTGDSAHIGGPYLRSTKTPDLPENAKMGGRGIYGSELCHWTWEGIVTLRTLGASAYLVMCLSRKEHQ